MLQVYFVWICYNALTVGKDTIKSFMSYRVLATSKAKAERNARGLVKLLGLQGTYTPAISVLHENPAYLLDETDIDKLEEPIKFWTERGTV